jgi:type IV pilus assembly protein PilE
MELMVVVVIVSILTAIAIPSYRSYVIRTHRTVAKSLLSDIAARQESYYIDHKVYADNLTKLGYIGNPLYIDSNDQASASASTALYRLDLQATISPVDCSAAAMGSNPKRYGVTASPQNSFLDPVCATLCVDGSGNRGSSVPNSLQACWGR